MAQRGELLSPSHVGVGLVPASHDPLIVACRPELERLRRAIDVAESLSHRLPGSPEQPAELRPGVALRTGEADRTLLEPRQVLDPEPAHGHHRRTRIAAERVVEVLPDLRRTRHPMIVKHGCDTLTLGEPLEQPSESRDFQS